MTLIKIAATVAALAITQAAAAQDISGANPSAVDNGWQFPEFSMDDLNHVYEWEDAVHDIMMDPSVQAQFADEVARGAFVGTLEEFADAFLRVLNATEPWPITQNY